MHKNFSIALAVLAFLPFCQSSPSALAQSPATSQRPLIAAAPDDASVVPLPDSVPAQHLLLRDLGPAPDSMQLEHLQLVLQRSSFDQSALTALITHLNEPSDPLYQRWLSPDQFDRRFSLPDSDSAAIHQWLQSRGLAITSFEPSRLVFEFSGSAAQIAQAFHTPIHRYLGPDGRVHFANPSAPAVPVALVPAIAGIIGLDNFSSDSACSDSLTPAEKALVANAAQFAAAQGLSTNSCPSQPDESRSGNSVHPLISAAESILVNFTGTGGANPGSYPVFQNLTQASDGNFYGTTEEGGTSNDGTVFQMTPAGVLTVLHAFTSGTTDGQSPNSSIIQGTDGNFYGTTYNAGANGLGIVFRILGVSPYTYTVLHSFAGGASDGASPEIGLVQGTDGHLYGTTFMGGSSNLGTVFKISTTSPYPVTILHSFTGSPDGEYPVAALVQGTDGNLYSTTFEGGANNFGTVFNISPTSPYTLTILHSFAGTADGQYPYGTLIQGTDGQFYGTADLGGANSKGSIFKISSTSPYPLTLLHSYVGGTGDGQNPQSGLVLGSDGNYYGTTFNGGSASAGTAIVMTPAGAVTLLHAFAGGTADGSATQSGLVQGTDGNYYGLTYQGGTGSVGIVYKLTMTPTQSAPIQLSVSPTNPIGGETFTLTYTVANAYSDTMQQCFATNTAGDATGWVGIKTGSATATNATLTANSAIGTYAYTLTCGGMESSTLNVTSLKAAPTTATISSISSPYGSTAGVTITATESGSSGVVTGGVVTFSKMGGIGGSFTPTTCTLTAAGTCTTTYNPSGTLAGGTYTNDITASFAANNNYVAATASATLTITPAATATATMTSPKDATPQSQTFGNPTAFTVTGNLAWTGGGTAAPTVGDISFISTAAGAFSAQTCSLTGGGSPYVCSATYTPTAANTVANSPYDINLQFTGDSNYDASTSSQSKNFVITQQSLTFGTGSVTPSTNVYGTSTAVTISQVINWTGTGAAPPAGRFGFTLNAVTYTPGVAGCTQSGDSYTCTYSVPGATIAALTPGSYPITLSYSPGGNYVAVTSQPVATLTITQATTNATITSPTAASPSTQVYGAATAVSVTGKLNWSGAGTAPTIGNISFTSTATGSFTNQNCTTSGTLDTCTVTFTPTATDTVGAYGINISFSGDTNYSASASSQTQNLLITQQSMTFGAGSVSPATNTYGTSTAVTITQVVNWTGSGTAPDSSKFSFTANATSFTPTCTQSGDSYSCTYTIPGATIAALAVGSYPVTMSWGPSGNYLAFSGQAVGTFTVSQQTPTAVMTSPTFAGGPATQPYGSATPVPLTGKLAWSGSGSAPTSSDISFTSTAAGTITAASCTTSGTTYTCTATFTPTATDTVAGDPYAINISFAGDTNYATAVSGQTQNFGITRQTMTFGAASVTPNSVAWDSSQAVTISQVVNWTGTGNAPDATKFAFQLNSVTYTPGASGCAQSGNSYTCTYSVPAATIAALNAGSYPVTMSYTPAGNYASFTGQAVGTLVITQAVTSVALVAATPGSPSAGVTSSVLTASMGPAVANATVTFTDTTTNTVLGTALTNASGQATFTASTTTTGIAGGLNNFTATVTGTTNYSAATSTPVTPVYFEGMLFSLTAPHDFSVCYSDNGTGSPVPCAPYVSGNSGGTLDGSPVCNGSNGINGYTCTAAYGITLYNFTGAAQTIGTIFNNSAEQAFSYATNCGTSLAAGATCQYAFYYKPPYGDGNSTTAGLYETGNWQVTVPAGVITGIGDKAFDRSGATSFPATLAGYAVLLDPLSVTPLSLTFGPQASGSLSATQTVTVSNTGGSAVALSYTLPSGSFIVANNCPAQLAANTTCTIGVQFQSSTAGTTNSTLVITPTGASAVTVNLSGSIVSSTLSLSTAAHNFGSITLDSPVTSSVTLTNTSSGSTSLAFATAGSSEFTYNYGTCGSSLAAGASCTLSATFDPTASGAVSNTLTITSSIPIVPGGTGTGPYTGTIVFSGTGTSSGQLTVSTSTHNFGDIAVNSTGPVYGVTLTNNSGAAVSLTYGSLASTAFALQATNCGATLANTASCQMDFTFTPTAVGFTSATYTVSANGGAVPLYSIAAAADVSGITLEGTGTN